MPSHSFEFTSWIDFVNKAEFGESDLPNHSRSSHSKDSFSTGTESLQVACELARTGWEEGAAKITSQVETVTDVIALKKFRKEIAYAMTGPGTWDIGRLIQEHPMPWVTFVNSEDVEIGTVNKGVVSIAFNGTVMAYRTATHIFQKGALICSLVDLLESSGIRVELILTLKTQTGEYNSPITVRVKEAQEILDLDRVVFALANASTLRRLAFSVWEQMPKVMRDGCGIGDFRGYGRVGEHEVEDAINIKSDDLIGLSEEEQIKWLKKQLKENGVEVVE